MTFLLASSAAVGCATCNGVAAILQKLSADKERKAKSLEVGLMWRLAHDWPYLLGTALDIVAGMLILVAVHSLPLFLVSSIIASSIAITFIIERVLTGRKAQGRLYGAVGLVLIGLITIASAASPETAKPIGSSVRWSIVLAPLFIALIGMFCSRLEGKRGTISIAILSGVAFGGSSISGRALSFSSPVWHTLTNPLLYSFVIYGTLGLLLFSIGLQRSTATKQNTLMTASQTLVPAIVGIAFFGDSVRHGLWWLAFIGVTTTLIGVITIGLSSDSFM